MVSAGPQEKKVQRLVDGFADGDTDDRANESPVMNLGLQSYLRFEGGTEVGAMFGSSHTEPEEVRLEP